jgi:hypothetical protein
LSDGLGVLEAIVGVLDGDEAAAWSGASGALVVFLMDASCTTKELVLKSNHHIIICFIRILRHIEDLRWGIVCTSSAFLVNLSSSATSIITCLNSEDHHSCWGGAMDLLRRLVRQHSSLSHIDLHSLDFLEKGSGLKGFLSRCCFGQRCDTDRWRFHSACSALLHLSRPSEHLSSPLSVNILVLYVAAAQACSYDPALRCFGLALSNLSEDVNYCSVLHQAKCHEYALAKVSCVSVADEAWNDAYSVASCALSTIVNMSRNDSLHNGLKQARVIEILTPLANASCVAELRALMVLSYIIGCKENTSPSLSGASSALARLANSSSIGKIIDCLENTLALRGGPGYTFGFVLLPAILQVCSVACALLHLTFLKFYSGTRRT